MKKVRLRNAHTVKRGSGPWLRTLGTSAVLLATVAGCAPPAANQDFISGSHGILPFSIVENPPTTQVRTTLLPFPGFGTGSTLFAEGARYTIGKETQPAEAITAAIKTTTPNTHFNTTVSFGPGQAPFRITLHHVNLLLGTYSSCTVGAVGKGFPNDGTTPAENIYESPSAFGSVTTAITNQQPSGDGITYSVSATGTITVKNCTTLTGVIGQQEFTTSVEDWQVSFKGTAI
jgi:hypothetical protein